MRAADIDADVRKAIEHAGDVGEILGMVPDVERHPPRPRVTREQSIARLDDRREAGKVAAVERPVGMVRQLLVALVEPIDRREERLRIGDVDGHRQLQRGAGLPHRIEARVVDGHQRAVRSRRYSPSVFSTLTPRAPARWARSISAAWNDG